MSRTRRLENLGKKGAATTATKEEEAAAEGLEGVAAVEGASSSAAFLEVGGEGPEGLASPSLPMPELLGEERDFWEGRSGTPSASSSNTSELLASSLRYSPSSSTRMEPLMQMSLFNRFLSCFTEFFSSSFFVLI